MESESVNNLVDRAHAMWELFVKELTKFGLVGAAAWVVNAAVVWLLMHTAYFAHGHIKAKIVATVVATVFSWIANRLWTFRAGERTGRTRFPHFFAVGLITPISRVSWVAPVDIIFSFWRGSRRPSKTRI